MSFRFATLASGSRGNCCYIEYNETRLLIDAGISCARIRAGLGALGTDPAALTAILLTHEHRDHTAGLGSFLRKYPLPVYATEGTFAGLSLQPLFEKLPKACFHLFKAGAGLEVGDWRIQTLPLSHDALEPVAYRLDAEGVRMAVVTDLGCFDEKLASALSGLDLLLLEANHDRRMLEMGPYPYPLKLRIDGKKGHLSNEACAALLKELIHPGLKAVILGHLSQINNYPPLAREAVRSALTEAQIDTEAFFIRTAPAETLSEVTEWNIPCCE